MTFDELVEGPARSGEPRPAYGHRADIFTAPRKGFAELWRRNSAPTAAPRCCVTRWCPGGACQDNGSSQHPSGA